MGEHRFVGVPAQLGRQHWRSDGRPKKPYGRRGAEAAAARLGVNAYRCSVCKRWHVGRLEGE